MSTVYQIYPYYVKYLLSARHYIGLLGQLCRNSLELNNQFFKLYGKPGSRVLVSGIIVDKLKKLKMKYPVPEENLSDIEII